MGRKRWQCFACGRKIELSEVGASVERPEWLRVWCITCWDSADEIALRQYQKAQAVSS